MGKNYTFREITDREELLNLFLFRYKIYSDSELKIFLKENTYKIDIDHYDVHSRHFGLFYGNDLAGCMRVVYPKDEITNYDVLTLGKQCGLLDESDYFHKNGKAPFPFLSYEKVPQNHWQFYNDLTSRNERLAESSRFMLHPEHRSIRTSKFLCECAVTLYVLFCIGKKHATTCVRKEHAPFYERYGFIPIANGESFIQCDSNLHRLTLTLTQSPTLSQSSIPKHLQEKFEMMAEEFRATGKMERAI